MTTINDLRREGVRMLEHIPLCGSKRRQVDYIISGILGISITEVYLKTDAEVGEAKINKIAAALEERRRGVPIQYILGEVEFFSLPFYVRDGVFIPRPETELLVEEALRILKMIEAPVVFDICTGCGNIALSLAKNSFSKIAATDISWLSLEAARENAMRLNLSDRVEFLEGDLFEPLEKAGYSGVGLIISNPPYITSSEWDNLHREVRDYEPAMAIFGGEDGMDFYKRISKDAGRFIKHGGYLLLEVGHAKEAVSILEGDSWTDIKVMKDYNNLDRIISCRWDG